MSLLFSCEKNDIDETGTANLKVVNASPGSQPLSFFLAGKVLVEDGLAFGQSTGYLSAYAGTRLSAEFRSGASGATYATSELWLYKNENFTVFVAGDTNNARIKFVNDDLSSPDNGKAKIKFVHLSDQLPSDVNLRYPNGDKFIDNISRNTQSGYKQMAPGSLQFNTYGTAQDKNVGAFEVSGIEIGGVYVVLLSGNDSAPSGITEFHNNALQANHLQGVFFC